MKGTQRAVHPQHRVDLSERFLIQIVNHKNVVVHNVSLPPPDPDPRTKWIENFNREYAAAGLRAEAVSN